MKRQRGRGRKPGGGNPGNRPFESNGPDVKIRGTAAQIYEKYSQYARDAQSSGDRVKYENYLQHAEHYYRIMVATMPRDRLMQPQEGGGFHQQQPGEERAQPDDASADPMKVMDEPGGEDADDGFEADDAEDAREGEDVEAAGDDRGDQGGQHGQGHGQGRGRRRRGRRRHGDGPQGDRPPGGGGNGGGDPEARSALDSLARKQGALAGG